MARWALRIVGGLLALVVLAVIAVWVTSGSVIGRTYDVAVEAVPFGPADSATLARGRHLVDAVGLCRDCHGADLSGQWILDDPPFARLHAANITPGGVVATYTDADWVRTMRHGVKPDGRSAVVMPSESYRYWSDADLAAAVAYLRSVPAVEAPSEGLRPGPIGRTLIALGPLRAIFVANRILADTMPAPTVTEADTSVAYGYYLAHAAGCMGCHGPGLTGGPIPGGDPASPPAANITPGGIGSWDLATFERALRTGISADGSAIDPGMPRYAGVTDLELLALWAYLRSLPARAFAS